MKCFHYKVQTKLIVETVFYRHTVNVYLSSCRIQWCKMNHPNIYLIDEIVLNSFYSDAPWKLGYGIVHCRCKPYIFCTNVMNVFYCYRKHIDVLGWDVDFLVPHIWCPSLLNLDFYDRWYTVKNIHIFGVKLNLMWQALRQSGHQRWESIKSKWLLSFPKCFCLCPSFKDFSWIKNWIQKYEFILSFKFDNSCIIHQDTFTSKQTSNFEKLQHWTFTSN